MRATSLALFCLTFIFSFGQKKTPNVPIQKRSLDHSVYDSWKEIPYKALTNDGNFAVFTINPQEGDGKMVCYNLNSNTQDSVKRADNIALTFDSKRAVFKIKPQLKLVKDLRRQKKKKEDLPKDSLGIYTFNPKSLEKIPDVKSYKMAEKNGEWLAYQLEPKKEVKPKTDSKDKTKPEEKKSDEKKSKKKKVNSDDNGYTLTLRRFADKKEVSFSYVKDYSVAKFGQGLLFTSTGNDSTLKAGVYWYDLANEKLQLLYEGKSKYKFKGLSISEDGKQAAFLVDADTTKALIHPHKLYHWSLGNETAKELRIVESLAIPQNWYVSENYNPLFSKDGTKLYFGTNPKPVVQDTTLLSEEIVNVEVWRSDDGYIYPQQNKNLENEKKRSYLCVLSFADNSVVQLGQRELPEIEIGDEGNANVFLGKSDIPYRKLITWESSAYRDYFVYDIAKRQQIYIARKVRGNASLSPKAKYVFWFDEQDTSWFCYSIASEKKVRLNESLKIKFADEEDDQPDYPSSYGAAGWTKDDQLFLAYDRYDIWAFDPENKKAPVNLTKIGRQQKIVFRYLRLDPEQRFIDPSKELLLSAFNETTKASGYYKLSLTDGKLTKLMVNTFDFGRTVKAKNADRLLFTRENFTEFHDVWTADFNFNNMKKISNANPQMKNYLWGSVELVSWTSLDNIPLRGLLYKPENFDPKKKYPMMVYFYEKHSDELYSHFVPTAYGSTINYSLYVSNGYLVFIPDIVYKTGFPGESAYNCIMPGVTSLIAKGFVDEKHIGVQGHSWGGYQTAYLVTHTNLFAAAEAGAPVSNMVSAYGGIRWGSGLSRMFQYERSQSRIGGTLWQKPKHFIDNSPIFAADKILTPLLMMHNDNDGAVPWYQGIELYMALRRLNKPVWMLNYNGQDHNLTQRQDKVDFAIRMMQFFDHYLKGKPASDWMTKGVPATEKGIVKGY